MSRLESLITERKKELQELEDNSGTRFPMIEQATDIQIAYITKELSDLEMLQEHEKHQLNENQQIVLEWMKKEFPIMGVDTVLSELTFLSCTGGMLKNKVTATAWRIFSDVERLQILQAFAEWGLNHERN